MGMFDDLYDWFRLPGSAPASPPTQEDRVEDLKKRVEDAEHRAQLVEEEAALRKKLVQAQLKMKRAKQSMGGERSSNSGIVLVIAAVFVFVILLVAAKSC